MLCAFAQEGGGSEVVDTSEEEQNKWSASDEEVKALAEMAVKIEKHYGRPMDIEWARDGDDGKLYIVQARPETVASQKKVGVIEEYKMLEKGHLAPKRNPAPCVETARPSNIFAGPEHAKPMLEQPMPTEVMKTRQGNVVVSNQGPEPLPKPVPNR